MQLTRETCGCVTMYQHSHRSYAHGGKLIMQLHEWWDFLEPGPWKPVILLLFLACASEREEMLNRYLACPWDSGDWLGAIEADIQTFVWRDTRVSSSLGFCTFRKKLFYKKIIINSFWTLQYCAVIKIMDFRARQLWSVDQLCHLPAEGLCQVTTSMSLHSVIFLVTT